jgi:hypothetical protein
MNIFVPRESDAGASKEIHDSDPKRVKPFTKGGWFP